ncbi:MAG: bacterioferritin [Planctomycetes bacterium]|nr:bacterioferritin [Planctomycetota bacterium]MCW8136414.1 bacterioferritin [Planctomycetota bacterium]
MDKKKVIDALNHILEIELAGVVRYSHYSLMIFGYSRIPIVAWFRGVASESLAHAHIAGEYVTALGGHPSLKIGKLLETERHNIEDILRESIEHEVGGVQAYRDLLALVEDKDVRLEEYAREMIQSEENHISEIEKMLRKPGDLKPAT